jgi:DeoR/GlpR family transcriptional regulator of sugar metabolism
MNKAAPFFTDERHSLIRSQLAAGGRVLAAELAAQFGVSEATVRRDLRELAKAGLCRKVYGGAVAPAPFGGTIGERTKVAPRSKASLASATVRLLRPGQTVFIDAGTTNTAIARAIPADLELTVATNAPSVAAALVEHRCVQLIVLGGVYDRETGACLGAATLQAIHQIRADLFILGACGVDAVIGTTAFDPGEADVKRAMAGSSTALVVPATTDKLATAASFRITGPEAIAHLVVEAGAPGDILTAFEQQGSAIHRAS